jgi:alpha-beta hydrolase superfamily lysophospholipase
MKHIEAEWKNDDGIQIYWQEWIPDTIAACGVVLLVHGLGEHSGRYTHVANAFTQSGYILTAFDHRGHGRSGGVRGDETLAATGKDITHFLDEIRHRYPHLPIFLYGHSLGGLIVLHFILKNQPKISGVIATAPALAADKGVSPATILMAKVLSRLAPAMQINNGLNRNDLCRIPEVVEKYNTDPLVHPKITVRLGHEMMQAGKWIVSHSDFPLPLLLISGSSDRIIDPEAVRQFGESLSGDITIKILNGYYHEVHNDPLAEEVLRDIIGWINQRT